MGVAECVAGLAGVAAAQGRAAQAARLCGMAAALFDTIGAQMDPTDHAEYTRTVARVRAQLDEATFVTAWTAGRTMPLAQAVPYVLAGGD